MEEFELGGKYLQRDRTFSKNRDCTVISNLSGGIDSVYGTYKLLVEGERVLIHHCHLTSRKRMRYETIATARVLDWFREQGLDNFEYVDSAVVLPPAPHLKRMRDPEIIMALTGNLLRARRHIKRVAYWNIIGDTSTEDPEGEATVARIEMMYICARRRNIKIERPLQEMTKSEVIRSMPRELFFLCFWCRTPGPNGETCGTCKTCLSVYEDAGLIAELFNADDGEQDTGNDDECDCEECAEGPEPEPQPASDAVPDPAPTPEPEPSPTPVTAPPHSCVGRVAGLAWKWGKAAVRFLERLV